ncbi:acyloxyacyl hydrolase [Thermoproteota archaeon]
MAIRLRPLVSGLIIFLAIVIGLSFCDFGFAEEDGVKAPLKEVRISTGYGHAGLHHESKDYNLVPFYVQFGFDANPFFDNINLNPPGDLRFTIEPSVGYVFSPGNNVETSITFGMKYILPITEKFKTYAEAGVGFLYTTQHMKFQSTQFNFQQSYEIGLLFHFSDDKAINVGYRAKHFSNGSIKEPNAGVDLSYVLCGITIFY